MPQQHSLGDDPAWLCNETMDCVETKIVLSPTPVDEPGVRCELQLHTYGCDCDKSDRTRSCKAHKSSMFILAQKHGKIRAKGQMDPSSL